MRRAHSLIPIALGTLLLATGCGDTTAAINDEAIGKDQPTESSIENTPKQEKPADTNSEKPESENKENTSENTKNKNQQSPEKATSDKQAKNKAGETEKTKPEKPFSPILPPEDAKPLITKYPAEVKKEMPSEEAHGGDPTRTVPLGQTLLKGKKDLTDGPLQHYRLVAYYGNPLSSQMGILGEYPPKELMKKLKKQASAYSKLDPAHPAIPTIELIATVAQRNPGPDGNYVLKTPDDEIQRYVELAKKNDALLVLDVQLGRASVMHGVKAVDKYLKLPFVHLAIDTEYSVGKGEVPGVNLGHVDGSEIQKAIDYVTQLVEEYQLPDKIVMVHQFADGIITHKQLIHPTKNVEVVLNNDGFGRDAVKMAAYGKLVRKQPIQYGGFKLFYKEDIPLLTPKQVLKLDPAPAVVNYQ